MSTVKELLSFGAIVNLSGGFGAVLPPEACI